MVLGLGYASAILGFEEEGSWGTAGTPITQFVELISGSITKTIEALNSEAIPHAFNEDDEFAQGGITVEGRFEMEMRYEGMEWLIEHAMGAAATSVEVASFTVILDTNDMIDFKEDAGAELHATLTAGDYIMGESGAVASTLCKEVKDQLEAAGAGTYTVTFSQTTKKITIAVAGGAAAVQFLWKTGVSGSDNTDEHAGTLLGFDDTADGANGASDTGDNAVITIFDHTFTLAEAIHAGKGMTFELDEGVEACTLEGGKITSMEMSIDYNGFLRLAINVSGEDTSKAAATGETLSTAPLVNFVESAVTRNGTESVINFKFTLNNNLKTDRRVIGSRLIREQKRGGKREVTGSYNMEFADNLDFDDYVAATERAITLIFTTTAVIKTGFYYTITITFPVTQMTGATPTFNGEGPLTMEIPFKAYASGTDGATPEFNIVIRNRLSDVPTNV